MEPIELEIFFHTEETRKKNKHKIPYPLMECDIKKVLFFTIDCIAPEIDKDDNNAEYTTISVNNVEYTAPYSYSYMKKVLLDHYNTGKYEEEK